jgi:hypothetical membrane protein
LALSNSAKAGAALFIGTVQFGIGLMLSEVYYSGYGSSPPSASAPYGYSVFQNYVSDLGATCPTQSTCYIPPSAALFDTSIVLLGLCILASAYFLYRAFHYKPLSGLVAIAAIGAIGVGTFNETWSPEHSIFSLIVFLFAGLSAIVSFRFQKSPLSYFSALLGLVTLVSLLLYVADIYMGLGAGGMERMVVFPVLLWGIGFGGHLMASEDPT